MPTWPSGSDDSKFFDTLSPPVPMKDHVPSVSSASSSSSPPVLASKSKSSSSKQSSSTSNISVNVKKSKKQIPVPVSQVKQQRRRRLQEQQYLFPVVPVDDPSVSSSPQRCVASSQDRSGGGSNGQGKHNSVEIATTEKRMRTARVRDGGRTQSGGGNKSRLLEKESQVRRRFDYSNS